jgi:hypothetical protein
MFSGLSRGSCCLSTEVKVRDSASLLPKISTGDGPIDLLCKRRHERPNRISVNPTRSVNELLNVPSRLNWP